MIRIASESGGGDGFVTELMGQTAERGKMAVFDALHHLRNRTVARLGGPRSGRTYFVPGEGQATYTASRPGQAPASATGKLRQNINVERPKFDGREIVGRFGVDLRVVPYARRLEYGGVHTQRRTQAVRTPDGWFTVQAGTVIRTAPRPFLRPTLDTERRAVESLMQRRLDRG